jgi:hypothetical protein
MSEYIRKTETGFQVSIKALNIVLGLLFFALTIQTTIHLTATYCTEPQLSLYTYGVAADAEPIDTNTRFSLMQNNQTIGTATVEAQIKNGDTVAWYNAADSVMVPLLYEPRVWQEIHVNQNKVTTTEPTPITLYYQIAYTLWGLMFVGLNYPRKRRE